MERLSVTLKEIDEQRKVGWKDFGPEDFCHRCGGKNIRSWYTDSDRFNAAFGSPAQHPYNGIVCPGCFVENHERLTGLQITWKLIPCPQQSFRPARPRETPLLQPTQPTMDLLEGHPFP